MLTDQDLQRIETVVVNFRVRMGVPDDLVLDMTDLLRRMKISGDLASIIEMNAADLGDSAATFNPMTNAITVGKDAASRQNTRDRFTFAHEIGHKLADHQQLRHRKVHSAKQHGRQVKIDEAVANAFAAAILIPEHLANVDQSTKPETLANTFGVSLPMARLRLTELQRRHRINNGIVRAVPRAFDTGSYDESMTEMVGNARRWNS